MLTEDVVDLEKRRKAKQFTQETRAVDYVNDQLDHFVAKLIDDLKLQGIDEAQAEKLVGDRMSDLVLAFDLRNFDG